MAEDCLAMLQDDVKRMEIALRLFDYARRLLEADYGWEDGKTLSGGIEPQDIVYDVFERVAAGKRKFNDRYPCEVQLKGMVSSIISKLFQLKDAKLQTIDLPEDDTRYPGVEEALGVGGGESEYERLEYTERFFKLLEEHPKVKKDPDLGLVIMAYVEGAAGSKEVAAMTGIPVARVYEYNRNLAPILAGVKAKMK